MTFAAAYETDLAYIHDQGFGGFARGAAPGLLRLFRDAEISGRVLDLGCGSGIWAAELIGAGFDVVGVDISAAMIEIARCRAAQAKFHAGSFLKFPFPPCVAVTALGEVFNYLFDTENSAAAIEMTFHRIFDALSPGGFLVFDVAEPGRCRGMKQSVKEGDDWLCAVEYIHDEANQQLTRRIVSFRKIGPAWRRSEETHRQQLYPAADLARLLEQTGFAVRVVRSYGDYPLPESLAAFIAQKP
jgi:SAM-dependent methyltransferase